MKPGGNRLKGAAAEREVIKLIEPIVLECGGENLYRNLEQVRSGGHDLIGIDGLAIEIKRQETLSLDAWWRQACEQAGTDKLPVLIYRQSRQPWRVIMWGAVGDVKNNFGCRVQITFEDFNLWLRYYLTR